MDTRHIFVSYSRKNIAFVRRLIRDLENAGYEVWWDMSKLRGGDDWVRIIPETIDASEFFIVVLSPQSAVSEWVRREYTQALHRHKRIIPLMLVNTTMPFSMNTLNYIDFTVEEKYNAGFNSLLKALEYTGSMPVVPVTHTPDQPRRYMLPVTLVLFILLALMVFFTLKLPLPSTAAATGFPSKTPISLQKATTTGIPATYPIHRATVTFPPTSTQTSILGSNEPPSPTQTPAFQRLTFCVNSLSVNTINVRSGPGSIYARIGEPVPVGTCLDFRGQNEEATWLLVAPDQGNPSLRQYEGGWIFRELLGLGAEGLINLPAVSLTPTPTPTVTPTPARSLTP